MKRDHLPPMLDAETLRARLNAPLPDEAYIMNEHTGMTVIVPQFETERMDEVFGIGGWSSDPTILSCEKKGYSPDSDVWWEATAQCIVLVPRYKIKLKEYGGHYSTDRGNALKSACTDAMGKCFSRIGIGADVYKGLMNPIALPRERNVYLIGHQSGYALCKQGYSQDDAAERAQREWAEMSQLPQRTRPTKQNQKETK